MHGHFHEISMNENDIFMHENDVSMHKDDISMYENEIFFPRFSFVIKYNSIHETFCTRVAIGTTTRGMEENFQ